jgi:diketogulonate reductase-like aldo/keto reductase
MPTLIYGTAWKELDTERLTAAALAAGYRAIDTANQRRHYHEEGVGAALKRAFAEGTLQREELFLQTKFTDQDGQDHRLPYDPKAEIELQVEQSFASSLDHLGTTYLDSYVLHGPSTSHGIAEQDRRAWRAMEALARDGRARVLGVSNVDRRQLEELCRHAAIAPAYVQNRCYAKRGWDREVRAFCAEAKLVYQGFSLLTANRHVVGHPELARRAQVLGRTPAQLVFAYAVRLGILPLTGTSSETHLREDLEAVQLELDDADAALIARISS